MEKFFKLSSDAIEQRDDFKMDNNKDPFQTRDENNNVKELSKSTSSNSNLNLNSEYAINQSISNPAQLLAEAVKKSSPSIIDHSTLVIRGNSDLKKRRGAPRTQFKSLEETSKKKNGENKRQSNF
jgi:hypothetical protein